MLVCGGRKSQMIEKQNGKRRGGDQLSSVCLQKHNNSEEKGACLHCSVFVCE